MFPNNKAVQPCLARQADIRRANSFNSPAALGKFAAQKKTAQSNEQYDCTQRAVAKGRRPATPVTIAPPLPFPNRNCNRTLTPSHPCTP